MDSQTASYVANIVTIIGGTIGIFVAIFAGIRYVINLFRRRKDKDNDGDDNPPTGGTKAPVAQQIVTVIILLPASSSVLIIDHSGSSLSVTSLLIRMALTIVILIALVVLLSPSQSIFLHGTRMLVGVTINSVYPVIRYSTAVIIFASAGLLAFFVRDRFLTHTALNGFLSNIVAAITSGVISLLAQFFLARVISSRRRVKQQRDRN